jgi:hypothetical protein
VILQAHVCHVATAEIERREKPKAGFLECSRGPEISHALSVASF